ncbi:hypothetical protein BKA70DRAFT_1574559 [Coprinopsis sp. MPI-PUGE-AT-0042]|nr:hypothetical protein BKA70DRAFT_1574559 [Coprinopsis sp. MPI-PUGE-AT-0042]
MFILSTILALSAYILGVLCFGHREATDPTDPNEGVIPQGGNTTRFLSANAGFFYTDANGGRVDGSRTRFYYYLVRDPTYTNVGLGIQPFNVPQHGGFCGTAQCSDRTCTTAFSQAPTAFPALGSFPPEPPLYECPYANTTMGITFCPGGRWPTASVQSTIHPGSNNLNLGKCLEVRGAVFANGTPVQIYDCNGTPAQNWILNRGSTKVQLAGTSFCLDAGSSSS